MTIDKAIELLELRIKSPFTRANPDTKDAMQLAVEALKAWRDRRLYPSHLPFGLLPGETKR